MNPNEYQTYFEWYEFDTNVISILIADCIYKSTLQWVWMGSQYIVKFQYCWLIYEYIQSFMRAYE